MAANFLNYLFHLSVGRMVSAQAYGELESLISFFSIISVPAGTLTMIATKFSAGSKAGNDAAGSYHFLKWFNKKVIAYGFPVFFLAVFISPLLKDFFKLESVWPIIIIWIMMLLSFFGSATGGLLNGWQKFSESSWTSIWAAFIKLVFALALAYMGYDLFGPLGGFAAGSLVSYLLSLYFLRFIFKERNNPKDYENKIHSTYMRSHLWPIFWGNLAITVLSNVDMVLAKHNLSPELAGEYGALTIISKIILFVTGVMATVLFSMSSEENHKKSDSRKTLRQAFWITFVLSLGALIIYAFFPRLIMGMLFGNKYYSSAPYLVWFAISVILFSFANLIFQYLISINKTKIAYSIMAIAVLTCGAVFLAGHSIFAIITIMIAAQGAACLAGIYFLLKNLKKQKYEKDFCHIADI